MLQVNNLPLAKKNLQVLKGYIAFNAGDRDALASLFCDDVTDADGTVLFPKWHLMDGHNTIVGKEKILDYLVQDLQGMGTQAEFLGVGTHGNTAITLDYTTGIPNEQDHVCGDRVEFDESDRIKEVWHCATATHQHPHAGHSEAS